jgi:hypothetical protein
MSNPALSDEEFARRGNGPFNGMALLWANDLNVQCVEGGHLAVETHFVEE